MSTRSRRSSVAVLVALAASVFGTGHATAAEPTIDLGDAGSFAVLAGSTVTNTGPSVIRGSVAVSPGPDVVGFPPGLVNSGTIHEADGVADGAKLALTDAYLDAEGRTPATPITGDTLGGLVLVPGLYGGGALDLAGPGVLTLDGEGDPDAVFVFQASSTLITGSNSVVSLIGGAQPCNVFWQVGSSATLGSGSDFVGTILADDSITAVTGADVRGRLLARTGAVTLDTNRITNRACSTASSGGGSGGSSSTSTSTSTTSTTSTTMATTSDSSDGSPTPSSPTPVAYALDGRPIYGYSLAGNAIYGFAEDGSPIYGFAEDGTPMSTPVPVTDTTTTAAQTPGTGTGTAPRPRTSSSSSSSSSSRSTSGNLPATGTGPVLPLAALTAVSLGALLLALSGRGLRAGRR